MQMIKVIQPNVHGLRCYTHRCRDSPDPGSRIHAFFAHMLGCHGKVRRSSKTCACHKNIHTHDGIVQHAEAEAIYYMLPEDAELSASPGLLIVKLEAAQCYGKSLFLLDKKGTSTLHQPLCQQKCTTVNRGRLLPIRAAAPTSNPCNGDTS